MFQIGEFSKLAKVSGRLLRYYEEINLLAPEFTDPQTGYRYYSAKQLPQLNRILVLKELGLSLEQIALLLDQNTSTEEIRGMLTLRKAQIEQAVQAEMDRLRLVEARLQQIDVLQECEIILKSIPAQPFLSVRAILPGVEAAQSRGRKIRDEVPAIVGQHNLGQMMVILHSPLYEPETLDVEIGFVITGEAPATVNLTEEWSLVRRELPAVENMATLTHVKQGEKRSQTYTVLGAWTEQDNGKSRTKDAKASCKYRLPAKNIRL